MVDQHASYIFLKRGVYYYSRRIPSDLRSHYKTERIVFSLRTTCSNTAITLAQSASFKLHKAWTTMRLQDESIPGEFNLHSYVQEKQTESITLKGATSLYLNQKKKNRSVSFKRGVIRAVGYVIETSGNKFIEHYKRSDANKLRDYLLQRGLVGSSITRTFTTVRALLNYAYKEQGLTISNPYSGVNYDRSYGVQERKPIPQDSLRAIQQRCRAIDDEPRWLISLVSDTGMRLAEAAGLLIEDLKVNETIPHVVIKEYPWRRLKTKDSNRVIPLVGESLWSASRIVENQSSQYAFPKFNKTSTTNSNSASSSLNKWIKGLGYGEYTMHCFRHSLRDRLRAIECPTDIADQIGGWSVQSIGQGYGSGYSLKVIEKWIESIVF